MAKKKEKDNSVLISVSENTSSTQDEYIYTEILDAILERRLDPGVKLKEDELADIFSVSRTIVRRAILRLSHDRIVDIQPNRGATVVKPDVQTAREVIGARRLIESELIKQATESATPEAIAELKKCVEDERDQVRRQHVGSGLRLSGDFHIQLSLLSGNKTLAGYLKELVPQTSLIIATYQTPDHTLCAHKEHFDIIDVIASGDVEAAKQAMDSHLQHIEDKLNLEQDHSGGDLYATFAHISNKDKK